jgi:hypothetical protein
LKVVLERVDETSNLSKILFDLEFLIAQEVDAKTGQDAVATFSFEHCADSVEALKNVLMIYVDYSTEKLKKQHGPDVNVQQILGNRYKTGMCRELQQKGRCSRGTECTYAHSTTELQRYREMATTKSSKVQATLHENGYQKSHLADPVDLSHSLSMMTVSSPDTMSHSGSRRSTIHCVDRESLDHLQLPSSIKHLSGSVLTGSDPGLLAESTADFPEAALKSYSSTSDLYSHQKYSVPNVLKPVSNHSASEIGPNPTTDGNLSDDPENLDVRRRKQMMEVPLAQGPPVSMKRASLPLTTEAYSPHPLSSYSTSSSRGMDSHHTEHYDTVYSEDGTSRNHHLDSHIVHRLPAGSDTKYRVLSGSSTPVQYPNYLPQYRSVISANDPRTVMTTAPPFYPQYHVSSGGQPQAVNFSHPGVPIYHNLSTISETNVMAVDPRLPQISFKPPNGDYNSFPVYVDPSYYTTYP